MKISILMSLSVNGFIARTDGEEDFLSNDNWQIMKDYIKEYDNLIWGRKTYESVINWGEEYRRDLENVNLVIASSKDVNINNNVVYCKSPVEAIKYLENKGMQKILISGGAKLNSEFIKQGLADELILSYNPIIIPDGINLFNNDIIDIRLKLKEIKELNNDIVYVKYEILK